MKILYFKIISVLIALAIGLSACSQKQVYQALQEDQKLRCQKEPPSMYEQCMKQNQQTYREYASERETLLKKEEKPQEAKR